MAWCALTSSYTRSYLFVNTSTSLPLTPHSPNPCVSYSSKRTWDAQREKGMSWHSCSSCRVANLLAQHVRAAAKFSDGWPHFWVQMWTPKWGPELDHIFIPSFRSLLGPRFGVQIWTQKWGQPSENFAAARIGLQADLRRTSMSVSVNTRFFSLCVPLCFLYSSNRTWGAQREKGMSWHSCSSCRVANLLAQHVRAAAKFSDGWLADPIFGSKCGPQNGVQNWITFSFLLLGLCLGPVLRSRFGPKSGVSHRRILLLPAEVCKQICDALAWA